MFGLGFGFGSGSGFGFGLGWDDLDDHFRWLQPIDLNLDLLGAAHLDHESRVDWNTSSFTS